MDCSKRPYVSRETTCTLHICWSLIRTSPQNNFEYQSKLKQSNALQQSQITRTIQDIHKEAQN